MIYHFKTLYMESSLELLKEIRESQKRLESLLLSQKKVLTFDEAATFIGISKSHLYKLTMTNSFPFYKPRGKMIYMDRVELENWLLTNKEIIIDSL